MMMHADNIQERENVVEKSVHSFIFQEVELSEPRRI